MSGTNTAFNFGHGLPIVLQFVAEMAMVNGPLQERFQLHGGLDGSLAAHARKSQCVMKADH